MFILLDARHGMKQVDREFLQSLQGMPSSRKIQLIMTKCDLAPVEDVARRHLQITNEIATMRHCIKNVLMVSGKNLGGVDFVRKEIFKVLQIPQ